ncbi:unnamed protein product, partial [marine sediment metagenome]
NTMIPTDIVREKTGLNYDQLYYLHTLGLIPNPTRSPTPGRGGSTSAYPAPVLDRILHIQALHAQGIPFTRIARQATGTPFECPPREVRQ